MSAIQMAALLLVSGGVQPFNFAPIISADTLNYNLRDAAVAAGWNQVDPLNVTVTINSGVYVGSSTTSGYGFDTGASFPAGTTLALVNNGFIVGAGGAGGSCPDGQNPTAGGAGGPALRAQAAITIANNGTVGGGGGGGGGGGPGGIAKGGGGGGGGGRGLGGGAGGVGGSKMGSGTAGSKTAAGPGRGNGANQSGPSGEGGGGGGGDLGSPGSPGGLGTTYGGNPPRPVGDSSGAAGGAAGAAVVGNANITWVVTGTRLGSIT